MKSEIIKNDKNDDTRIIYIDRLDLKKIEKNIEKSTKIMTKIKKMKSSVKKNCKIKNYFHLILFFLEI